MVSEISQHDISTNTTQLLGIPISSWRNSPSGARHPHYRGFTVTQTDRIFLQNHYVKLGHMLHDFNTLSTTSTGNGKYSQSLLSPLSEIWPLKCWDDYHQTQQSCLLLERVSWHWTRLCGQQCGPLSVTHDLSRACTGGASPHSIRLTRTQMKTPSIPSPFQHKSLASTLHTILYCITIEIREERCNPSVYSVLEY